MKTLALVLLPYIMVGQTIFKMPANVREQINGKEITTESFSVVWGTHREVFEFILPHTHLVLKPVKPTSDQHLAFEKQEQAKIMENEKLHFRMDEWGNKYTIRVITGNGLIIFINDYTRNYTYMIDFL